MIWIWGFLSSWCRRRHSARNPLGMICMLERGPCAGFVIWDPQWSWGSAMKLWLPFLCFFMLFPYHNFNSNLTMSCKWTPLQEETDRIQQDLGDLQRSRSVQIWWRQKLTMTSMTSLILLGEERSDSAVILGIGNPLLDISAEVSQAWDGNSEERFRGVGCVGWWLGMTLEDWSCGTKLNFTFTTLLSLFPRIRCGSWQPGSYAVLLTLNLASKLIQRQAQVKLCKTPRDYTVWSFLFDIHQVISAGIPSEGRMTLSWNVWWQETLPMNANDAPHSISTICTGFRNHWVNWIPGDGSISFDLALISSSTHLDKLQQCHRNITN